MVLLKNGHVNIQNNRYWSTNNPRLINIQGVVTRRETCGMVQHQCDKNGRTHRPFGHKFIKKQRPNSSTIFLIYVITRGLRVLPAR